MTGRSPDAPPDFAVVLASCRASAIAAESLRSLKGQCEHLGVTLVVARAAQEDSTALIQLLDGCRVVRCEAGTSVPALRGAGLSASDAGWVAMTEDNCVADPGWLSAMMAAAHGDVDVVGGFMDNARRARAIDWGAYFAEYGFFGSRRLLPAAGQPALVTGANVAYRRTVLADAAAWASEGTWEDVIHGRLAARGARFALAPGARVSQNLHYALGAFCRDRFAHGRGYAAVRTGTASLGRRLLFALGTPALAPLLAWRVWKSAGRDAPMAFVRALPATLTFLGAWAAGELAGYLAGPGADA